MDDKSLKLWRQIERCRVERYGRRRVASLTQKSADAK
jgi:hypothetical protein